MIEIGDTFFDGHVVVVSTDPTGTLITSVTVDVIKDDFGNPLTLTFNPAITVAALQTLLGPLFP